MNPRKKGKRFILNLFQENCQEVQMSYLETLGERMQLEKKKKKKFKMRKVLVFTEFF